MALVPGRRRAVDADDRLRGVDPRALPARREQRGRAPDDGARRPSTPATVSPPLRQREARVQMPPHGAAPLRKHAGAARGGPALAVGLDDQPALLLHETVAVQACLPSKVGSARERILQRRGLLVEEDAARPLEPVVAPERERLVGGSGTQMPRQQGAVVLAHAVRAVRLAVGNVKLRAVPKPRAVAEPRAERHKMAGSAAIAVGKTGTTAGNVLPATQALGAAGGAPGVLHRIGDSTVARRSCRAARTDSRPGGGARHAINQASAKWSIAAPRRARGRARARALSVGARRSGEVAKPRRITAPQ